MDDPHLWRFPNPDDLDYLFQVSAYVAIFTDNVGLEIMAQECCDVLVINNYLHHQLDRRSFAALTRAHQRCGLPWSALAKPLGVRTYQGAQQTWLRWLNAFRPGGGRRSEVDARHDLTLNRRPSSRDVPGTTAADLADLASQLVAARRLMPSELWEEVDSVRYAETPDTTLSATRWLLGALRDYPEPLVPELRALVDRGTALLAAR